MNVAHKINCMNYINIKSFVVSALVASLAIISLYGSPDEYNAVKLERGLLNLRDKLAENDTPTDVELVEFLRRASNDLAVIEQNSDYAALFAGLRLYMSGEAYDDIQYSFVRWPLSVSDASIFGELAYRSRFQYISDMLRRADSGDSLTEDEMLWLYMAISQLTEKEFHKYYDTNLLDLLAQCAGSQALNGVFSKSSIASEYPGNDIFPRNILDTVDSLYMEVPQIVWAYFVDDYEILLVAHLSAITESESIKSSMPSLKSRFIEECNLGSDAQSQVSQLTKGIENIYGSSIPAYSEILSTTKEDEFAESFFKRRGVVVDDSLNSNSRKLLISFANLIAYYDFSSEKITSIDETYDPRILFLHMFGL